MKPDNSIYEQWSQHQRSMQEFINPVHKEVLAHQNMMRELASRIEPIQNVAYLGVSSMIKDLRPTLSSIQEVTQGLGVIGANANSQLTDFVTSHQTIFDDIGRFHIPKLQETLWSLKTIEFNVTKTLLSSIGSLQDSFAGISSIDFSGIETLDIDSLIEEVSTYQPETQQEHSDLAGTLTINRTSPKLMNITVDDFEELIKKHTSESSKGSRGKTLSIFALITFVFDGYVKEIALVVLEIVFAFAITFITGQLNAEVVAEVGNRIEETKTYRDAKKIITRYVKVNPTNQIAFLRKESILRESHSKTSPAVSGSPITTRTVLTIIERKNNWVKVQVDTGDACGEIGWVQESILIKFKKID